MRDAILALMDDLEALLEQATDSTEILAVGVMAILRMTVAAESQAESVKEALTLLGQIGEDVADMKSHIPSMPSLGGLGSLLGGKKGTRT